MPLTRRRACTGIAAGLGLAALAQAPAIAQSPWPARPIRFIVPFPAGGGTDIIARELGNRLATANGWTVVMDNRPGSGGNLGVDAVAKAPPDGYTLVLGQTSNLAINPTLYSRLPYDPLKDLAPVSLVASSPLVLVVAADSPYATLADVVKAAKARPDALNYATSGNGTVAHLATEMFQRAAGIKLTHIPYKGASQGVTDVIGGQVQLYMSSVTTLIGHIRNGKLRALAVTSSARTADLPDVPTVAESGYKGFEAATWFGVLGPAGLPKEIVATLNAAINKALATPEMKARLQAQGADVVGSTPGKFAAFMHDEVARWGKVVKESGAKAD